MARSNSLSKDNEAQHNLLSRLASRVIQRRHTLGLSVKRCAERSGLSVRYWIQIEAGGANLSLNKLSQLSTALGLPMTGLISEGERGQIDQILSSLTPEQLSEARSLLARRFGPQSPQSVALLGVRGAGKSTLGKQVATQLEWRFIELDEEIEREAGMSLGELFTTYGESYYREVEGVVLKQLKEETPPYLIAAGGSLVTHAHHYNLLSNLTRTVYLEASAEELMTRVIAQGDQRPMRDHPHAMAALRALIKQRSPLYRSADYTLSTSGCSVDELVERLISWVQTDATSIR